MRSFIQTFFAIIFQPRRKQRIYIDAARFDPDRPRSSGTAVLLVTCNEEGTIFQRVQQEMRRSAGVVVLDQGSIDGTPFFAAEAGAVVVLQEQGQSPEEALRQALRVAKKFSPSVEIKQ
jgi:hypothetical protein